MTVSQRDKAKKDLIGVISGELSTLLQSTEQMREHTLSYQTVSALSLSLAEHIIGSEKFLEKVAEFIPRKDKQWLTTEEAAQKSGFSRPFIVALLDGPHFEGRVTRTEKGHRRVAASDFEHWMEKNQRPADLPTQLADVRSASRHDEPSLLPETASEKKRRSSTRDSALALARGMGLG